MAALVEMYQRDLTDLVARVRKVRGSGLAAVVMEAERLSDDEKRLLARIKLRRCLSVTDSEMLSILAESSYVLDEKLLKKDTAYS